MQTAIEQVRWNGPRVEELTDGEQGDTEHFLSIDALLPYVNQPRHDMCDLLLDSDHVSASMLRIPVHGDKADAVKKELAKYR